MKLYFAGAESYINIFKDNGIRNILMSYFTIKKKGIPKGFDLLLDSGAFSAFTQKKIIDIDKYCEYIKHNDIKTYACLDVIGDGDKTFENQKYMENKGLKPIPTYHLGSDKKYFERLVNEYDYIGLGGMVQYSLNTKKIGAFLDYCFHYIQKNKLRTKIHGWGMTNYKFLKKYPFYSVDSTARLAPGKFNRMQIFKNGHMYGFTSSEYRERFGIDFGKLHHQERNKISIEAYLELEKYVTRLHKAKGMEYRE